MLPARESKQPRALINHSYPVLNVDINRQKSCKESSMNKKWLISIFSISFILIAVQKREEVLQVGKFYRPEKILKLQQFDKAKRELNGNDLEMLKLWESILTGRSRPVSAAIKERYKMMGLSHIFTPSGFHLSAVLNPIMKIIKNYHYQLILLFIIGLIIGILPGFSALKRMVLIKGHQKILGTHIGFITALLIDVLFGTFQNNTLSFTYSFLFLGIIYSGLEGLGLIFWFFFAQILLAYFQGDHVSLFLLIFSPILNLIFSLIMPILFMISFPLWSWQIDLGIFLLDFFQYLVNVFAQITTLFPSIEIHSFTLVALLCFLLKEFKMIIFILIVFSNNLNLDVTNYPQQPRYYFLPIEVTKVYHSKKDLEVYYKNGKCRYKLIKGFWWESCSPKRRSNYKKIKKLSSLS